MADSDRDQSGEELVALIAAAKSGDESALDTLIGSCRGYLLSLAQQEMGCDIQAKLGSSDVVQETCIRVAEGFDGFRGESRAELFGWLKTILLNNMHDARRDSKGPKDVTCRVKRRLIRERALSIAAAQLTLDQLTPGSSAEFSGTSGGTQNADWRSYRTTIAAHSNFVIGSDSLSPKSASNLIARKKQHESSGRVQCRR